MDTEETEVCRAFRNNGRCRYGQDCRFVHSEGAPIQPTERVRSECFNWRDNGSCEHGDRCRFTHGEDDARFSSARDPSDEICRNYQRGRCKFGEECRRKHVEPEVKETTGRGDGGDRESKPKREREPRKPRVSKPRREAKEDGGEGGEGGDPSDEVCRNFLAGRCRFGEECRRKHEGTPTPEAKGESGRRRRENRPVKKLDEVCNNFQAGKCRLGDRCRRQHVEGEGTSEQQE